MSILYVRVRLIIFEPLIVQIGFINKSTSGMKCSKEIILGMEMIKARPFRTSVIRMQRY